MIRSILLPIDGSNYSESVLQYGLFLGKKLNARLRVITIVDVRLFEWNMAAGSDSFVPVVGSTEFQEETHQLLDKKANSILEKAKDILSKSEIEFEVKKITGTPVDEICTQAKANDLVIVGIRGEYEHWSGHLLGATIESAARQIIKPILLVDKTFMPFERIVSGYDGSDTSNKALQLSAFLANSLNLTVQVITVMNSEEERKEILAEAAKYLEPYKIEYQLRHESGSATDALINAQNSSHLKTLLSIGSFGHSRIREAILGSTTVQLMRKAQKPILLAK